MSVIFSAAINAARKATAITSTFDAITRPAAVARGLITRK